MSMESDVADELRRAYGASLGWKPPYDSKDDEGWLRAAAWVLDESEGVIKAECLRSMYLGDRGTIMEMIAWERAAGAARRCLKEIGEVLERGSF